MPQSNVVRISGAFKDPKTKGDFIDRMMSRDFSGDLKDLAVNGDIRYERIRPNALKIHFGSSNQDFELVIRKPRGPRELTVKSGAKRTTGRTRTATASKNPEAKVGEEPGQSRKSPVRRRMSQGNQPSTH